MPQIVEYVNKEGLTPTDRGTEARVQQGRRIGASFNQVAESLRDFGNRTAQQIGGAVRDAGDAAAQYVAHREIGQGVSSFALLQDSLINRWNDAAKNSDPNDPSVRQNFIDGTLTPEIEKWRDSFHTETGQNWAQGRTLALLDHMYEKTSADMGTLAAQAITNNMRTLGNTLSNTAYRDPASRDYLMRQVDESVGALVDSSPNLKGAAAGKAKMEIAEKIKESIAKSGMFGGIANSRDPEGIVARDIAKYPQYINGPEAITAAKAAKSQVKANDLMDRQATQMRRQEENDSVKAATAANIDKYVSVDDGGKVTVDPKFTKNMLDLLRRYPNAPNVADDVKSYINWAEFQAREKKENPHTWPDVMTDLYSRMSSPDNPTTRLQIYDAETTGKLSRRDAQNLINMEAATDKEATKTPQFQSAIKAAEEELGVGIVGDAHVRMSGFMNSFIPQYQKMVRAGTLPPDALNLQDPNSLISKSLAQFRPDSNELMMGKMLKKYGIGLSPENLPPNIKDLMQKSTGVTPTGVRNKGETYDIKAPPISSREVGKTYPTPRGPMKWNGTGWVQP